MLKHTSKTLLIKQNYKEKCLTLNTWYTIRSDHNTNQIQTLKTLEFLRYELWKEILIELLDAEQFWQSLGAFKLLLSLTVLQVCTPLYRGVRWTLWIASTSKKSRLKLWSITNDSLRDMVVVLWRINFKCIPCIKEHCCRQSCYPCLVAETNPV